MTATSPNRGRSASPSAAPLMANVDADDSYDEERLDWGKTAGGSVSRWSAWPRKILRLPRPRKYAALLLLTDIIIVSLVVLLFEPLITLLVRNEELFGARLTFPLDATPSAAPKATQHPQTIPRIFHQTIATEEIPEKWIHSQQTCKEAYKDFEYKLWTDEIARNFIEAEYSWFLDTWDEYTFPIQRADAIRYFVLYHYGGIYLDMDTNCNHTIPFEQLEADGETHHAVFKSTTPTGVSNDLMISSAGHPVLLATISKLLYYNDITRPWAKLLPHAAIMIGSGPFFLSMIIKNWLLDQPSLPTPAIQVINATELAPYITDLEGSSWHHGDTKTLMWVGDRPWVWFSLGAIGLVLGLNVINYLILQSCKGVSKLVSVTDEMKNVKLT
ncbi:hypothetical protein CEP53_005509 [Fusarium sp. AF-6]|nr:hypothetical protein CEP53_005509 [Fusarium sp. AF-6]